jgi:hypothetical protein
VLETARQTTAKPSRRPRLTAPHKLSPRASVRRFNGIVHKLTAELLRGRTVLAAGEREMIRQAAALMLRAEQLQADIVAGDSVNDDELIRVTSEMRRAIRALNPTEEGRASAPAALTLADLQDIK